MISFVVVIAMLTALLQSGAFSVDAHAESLGLRSYNGWFSNAKAVNKSQIRKVCNLAKSQTDSKVGQRVDDILFKATYKPSDIGGKDWVKDNRGSGIKSVYDPGLGTTVKWNSSAWGCYSYAMYVSKYVRGSTGSIISTDKGVVPSVSKVKWLLQTYADPGEHIRYYYKTPSGSKTVHSVAYLAGDSEGFYFASESGNYLNGFRKESFCQKQCQFQCQLSVCFRSEAQIYSRHLGVQGFVQQGVEEDKRPDEGR